MINSPELVNGKNSTLVDALLSRRSVSPRRLSSPGPDDSAICKIVAAAVTAADHGRLRPWRFIVVSGDAREALAETFVQLKQRSNQDLSAAELERERDRARSVPVLIAVVSRLVFDHPVVPVSEQYASVGAAIQNILLCAHGLGFGAKMVSGRKVRDPQLAHEFALDTSEELFGFICVGTAISGTSLKPRVPVREVLSYWHPQKGSFRASGEANACASGEIKVCASGEIKVCASGEINDENDETV